MLNDVPTQEEAQEAAENALGEVEREITRLDQEIARLEA